MQVEALHEVVNVLSALFNTPGAPHSKLHKLVRAGEDVPGDIAGMLAGFNRHRPRDRGPGLRQGRDVPRPAVTCRPPDRTAADGRRRVLGVGGGLRR